MTALEQLLPHRADNDYRGGRVPLYAFCLMATIMTGRSLVHFLKDDSGVNSIATIVTFAGSPDPNQVIYMFSSAMGSQQLITVLIYAIVLARYRNLIPLMFALMIVETLLHSAVGLLHPLTPEFYIRTPPGKTAIPVLLAFSTLMLVLSLRNTSRASDPA